MKILAALQYVFSQPDGNGLEGNGFPPKWDLLKNRFYDDLDEHGFKPCFGYFYRDEDGEVCFACNAYHSAHLTFENIIKDIKATLEGIFFIDGCKPDTVFNLVWGLPCWNCNVLKDKLVVKSGHFLISEARTQYRDYMTRKMWITAQELRDFFKILTKQLPEPEELEEKIDPMTQLQGDVVLMTQKKYDDMMQEVREEYEAFKRLKYKDVSARLEACLDMKKRMEEYDKFQEELRHLEAEKSNKIAEIRKQRREELAVLRKSV
jgi:hypothetical protein